MLSSCAVLLICVSSTVRPATRAVQVARNSDVIFIAVKPQVVGQVLQEARAVITESQTIVSIAAGVTIEK